eukprot:694448-Rhodomonas_salina.2
MPGGVRRNCAGERRRDDGVLRQGGRAGDGARENEAGEGGRSAGEEARGEREAGGGGGESRARGDIEMRGCAIQLTHGVQLFYRGQRAPGSG